MSLVFDERGLLTPGIHEASLSEVEEHFARFQRSERRIRLFGRLRSYLEELKRGGCGTAVVIDGSFVMRCVDEPEDIDLVLILPADWDMTADLKPFQYNLVSKGRVKRDYGMDMFPVREGSTEEREWIDFFARVNIKWCGKFDWPDNSIKGIARVAL